MRQTKVHNLRREFYEKFGRSPTKNEWRWFKKGIVFDGNSLDGIAQTASMPMPTMQDFFKDEKKIELAKKSWLSRFFDWIKKLLKK